MKSQQIVNKWEAQKALEGTKYIPIMYRYFGILPCEIRDDYRYVVIEVGVLELQTVVDGMWMPVMTFTSVEIEVGSADVRRMGWIERVWNKIILAL